jgi:DEAD/DEAH box helicase domain-containing protein
VRSVAHRQKGEARVFLGLVRVTQQVIGYRHVQQFREEVLGVEDLDLPAQTFDTVALWWEVPPDILARVQRRRLDVAGGLHAVEHAAIGLLPLFAMCDRWDIGGLSTPHHPDTSTALVFIYDAFPGGVGIAEKGFDLLAELWRTTYEAVRDCPCEDGCPSCIQVSMNNGQTKPMTGLVKDRHETQKPTEFDRFVHPDSLQGSINNRQTSSRRGVVLTGRLVLSAKR